MALDLELKRLKEAEMQRMEDNQRLEQMAIDDQKYIQFYQERKIDEFKYDSKKSLARNYRDYEIYKSLKGTEDSSFGIMEPAASFVMKKAVRCTDADDDSKKLLNLCRNTFTKKESNQVIKDIAEHLMAGKEWQGDVNPNEQMNQEMQAEARLALKELYTRQLVELDNKYGKKLAGMSASDYLKKKAEIDSDFSCIKDMRDLFEKHFGSKDEDDETKLMLKKSVYYCDCLQLLDYRAEILMSNAVTEVSKKGELIGDKKAEYESLKSGIQTFAADHNLFAKNKRKNKSIKSILKNNEARKNAAINAVNDFDSIYEKNNEKLNELAGTLNKLQGNLVYYDTYKSTLLSLDREDLTENDRYKIEINLKGLKKHNVIKDDEEYKKVKSQVDEITENMRLLDTKGAMPDITEDNIGELLDSKIAEYNRLRHYILESSDEEFVSNYTSIRLMAEAINTNERLFTNNEIIIKLRKKFKNQENISENPSSDEIIYFKYKEYYNKVHFDSKEMKSPDGYMKIRMEDIIKHGHTTGASLYNKENLDDLSIDISKELKEKNIVKPRSINELIRDLNEVNPADSDLDFSKLRNLLNTIAEIRKYKNEYPDYYRCGLSYMQYKRCELHLQYEDSIKELFSLRLRMLGLDAEGNTKIANEDYKEIERNYKVIALHVANMFSNENANFASSITQDESYMRFISKEIMHSDIRQDKIIDSMGHINTDEALIERMKKDNAFAFLEELPFYKDSSYAVAEKTAKAEISNIEKLYLYSDKLAAKEDISENDIPYEEVIKLFRDYMVSIDNVMFRMRSEGDFSDHAIADERLELDRLVLMGEFLLKHVRDTKLIGKIEEQYKDVPELEIDVKQLKKLSIIHDRIQNFADYSQSLFYGQIQSEFKDLSIFYGESVKNMSAEQIKAKKETLYNKSKGAIEKFRIDYLTEKTFDERRMVESKAAVLEGVGRELIASARKNKFQDFVGLINWCGNRLGAPCQALSWILHEKRTDNHGEVRYEELKPLMNKMVETIPEMETGDLPKLYFRDSEGYAPPVELDKLFSSPVKKDINDLLKQLKANSEPILQKNETDEKDEAFRTAIESIEYYTKVVGIVNLDTTEMEMACLDKFIKCRADYREYHKELIDIEKLIGVDVYEADNVDTQKLIIVNSRIELLDNIYNMYKARTECKLQDTIDADVLEEIDRTAISYVEDTIYSENMDESNIKDIPLFLHEPNINDVKQSSIGDCWLVSAISAIVKTNPDFIRSMFYDNGKGDVIVRLYAPINEKGEATEGKYDMVKDNVRMVPSYFKLKKQYETGYGNASDCTWVQLLEKAFALGGYNNRNEVEVKGNKLFNVADELTMGQIDLAMKVITGKNVYRVHNVNKIVEENYLAEEMMDGLLAGLDFAEHESVKLVLSDLQDERKNKAESEKIKYSYLGLKKHLLAHKIELLDNYKDFMPDIYTNIARGIYTDEELDQIQTELAERIWNKMESNLDLMLNGKELEFAKYQNKAANKQKKEKDSIIEKRRQLAMYFYENRRENMGADSGFQSFIKNIEYCIRENGNVGIAIPHCVDVIDVKWEGRRCFLLMRDPFNIYNVSYSHDENNELQRTTEEFGSVFTKRKENRNLIGNTSNDLLRGGFRGTSWYLASDIYNRYTAAHMVLPETVQIPDHKFKG